MTENAASLGYAGSDSELADACERQARRRMELSARILRRACDYKIYSNPAEMRKVAFLISKQATQLFATARQLRVG